MLSKKNILYTLKKKYNIYNGNLIHGVTQYINKYVKKTKRMERVVEILNNERLEELIQLRNESPVGHGFRGVSKEEIEEIEEKKRVKNKSSTSKGGRTKQEKNTLYYQMKQTELLPDREVRSRLDGNYGYFMKQNARDEIQEQDGIYFNVWDDFNN